MTISEKLQGYFGPFLAEKGFELCEVTYRQNQGEWVLYFAIDRYEGGIDLDTIVTLSEMISEKLDELDWISDNYTLDVSSPGAERPIDLASLAKFVHRYVHLHLSEPYQGENDWEGTLEQVDDENVVLTSMVKGRKKTLICKRTMIDKARLAVKF